MKRKLYVWRYLNRSTEYVDVIAYEEDVDPLDRLARRIPGAFGVRSTSVGEPYEIILERELAE